MVRLSNGTAVTDSPVVDLAMAKQNSNIEHDHTDAYLQLLLDASIQEAENYTGLSLTRRTGVVYAIDGWSDNVLLHTNPIEVTNVSYKDLFGVAVDYAVENYKVVSIDDRDNLSLTYGPFGYPELAASLPYPIEITMDVGYTAATCPADIKQAILLIFSDNELFREDRPVKLGRSSRVKLRPYRINR